MSKKKKPKREKFIHRPWSELRAEMEAAHGPGFNRHVRLEGVWYDISRMIEEHPVRYMGDPNYDQTAKATSLTERMDDVTSAVNRSDPDAVRARLIRLAARTVEWAEGIDATREARRQGPKHYTYRIEWSADDGEYVATCAEFPSLSWLAPSPKKALARLERLIAEETS